MNRPEQSRTEQNKAARLNALLLPSRPTMRVPSLPFTAVAPVNGHIPYYVCWPRGHSNPDIRQDKPDGAFKLSEVTACQYEVIGAEHLRILQVSFPLLQANEATLMLSLRSWSR